MSTTDNKTPENNNNKFTEFVKSIMAFLEKHKAFLKKLIVFIIAYVVLVVINNVDITSIFNNMFGEYITMGIKTVPMTLLITSEV